MTVTELTAVEHFIIYQLSGVNLNVDSIAEPEEGFGANWQYKPAEEVERGVNEVLAESELVAALVRLNPEINAKLELADEVIHKLRAILISVAHTGLVRANEEFAAWLKGEKTLPFGENNRHVPVRLIDFDNIANNSFIVTNQYRVHYRETKIPDIVLLINGIPVVVGEAKTPIRPSVSWLDGAHEIHNIYENAVPQLFVPNILSFATEGKEFFYGAVRTPLEFWSPWRTEDDDSALSQALGLGEVGQEIREILHPARLLDILQNFCLYSTGMKKRRIKIICRYQQYAGANRLVARVLEGKEKKGLIWHFQGSGKSLLMVFAAQKMRRLAELKSPTIIIIVDRTDLDTQITGTFNAADIPNLVATDSIRELHKLLERDTRKIIITTIHKFKDAAPDMNTRDNIIVLVDEAHRSQEGDLGRLMRAALPNAFLFGLTGTPVNKADKNTFWAFGSDADAGGYLSRYTFQDSLRDKATLPLHFEPRLVDLHIDKNAIDAEFRALQEQAALSDEQADILAKKAAHMSIFLKSPERVELIVKDIAQHFREKVEPHGLKAMIVTPDRFGCVQYKEELDKLMGAEASAVVISTSANDELEFKQKWGLDKDQQDKVIERFNDKESSLKFLIVTAKLLTGFDSPILQTMYLDKSLKDHTLLQAICRTNRLHPKKYFGRVVDYFGVFDDAATALEFDEKSVKNVITNLKKLREELAPAIAECLAHFAGVDRSLVGFEGLQAAQEMINTNEKRDAFAKDYTWLHKIWESLSPDPVLLPYNADYRWLSEVYESVRPAADNIGKLLWFTYGAQTTKLIHENVHVDKIHDLEEFLMDAQVVDDIFNNPNGKNVKRLEKELAKRFRKHAGNPAFKALSQRMDELRSRAEQGLITSIEFVKKLCELARDVVQAEKDVLEKQEKKSAKAALTELFLETRNDQTPAVVERIVNDIDEIVKIVRFDGWQDTSEGAREVQKSLRRTLMKYKLHKDNTLFENAYAYIKEYY